EYPEPVTNAELLKRGYRVNEVPVIMHERQGGESSIGSWKNIYYMVNVILSIFVVGTRRTK
ncbi:MAG: glycosyltransferase family 2 protein, partial [Bacilli bacterium]